jgi:hypothetical protein
VEEGDLTSLPGLGRELDRLAEVLQAPWVPEFGAGHAPEAKGASGAGQAELKGGNLVESHETTFTATNEATLTPSRNGRLRVGARSVSPDLDLAEPCPNPNWTPEFHEGSPTLDDWMYSLTFDGFTSPYITITP